MPVLESNRNTSGWMFLLRLNAHMHACMQQMSCIELHSLNEDQRGLESRTMETLGATCTLPSVDMLAGALQMLPL